MNNNPRVSIGLPVYNGARFLRHAFDGLLEQDFEDFELIVTDNASTDGTEEICRAFARSDCRIRYYRNRANIGLSANHNLAFSLARGSFFKWAAHDDGFPPMMLTRLVERLADAPPSVSLVYSRCEYIDESGSVIGLESDGVNCDDPRPHRRLAYFLQRVHMYNCLYGLIRTEHVRRTRMWGLYPFSDHVLFAELAMVGVFVELPEPLLQIRRHPGRTFDVNHTKAAFREVFTPGHGHRFSPLSLWGRVYLELMRSAATVPCTQLDKALCSMVALLVPQRRDIRNFGGRQKTKLKRLLSLSAAKTCVASQS
jgi:glycosyltransferase involved in cell wall biosynthesis